MKSIEIEKLPISIVICLTAGTLGSIFNVGSIDSWYAELAKPLLNPPNWVFGPVWTILYILIGISFYFIWRRGINDGDSIRAAILFFVQLILNILWSYIFFTLQSPFFALIEIILLNTFIIATMVAFYPISRKATWLLVPYLLWTSFATYLNFWIWILN